MNKLCVLAIECEVPRIQNAITNISNANIRIEMRVLYVCDWGYKIQGLNTDQITAVCQENKQLSRVPSCQREFYIYFLKQKY